jgi:hypothetical protein
VKPLGATLLAASALAGSLGCAGHEQPNAPHGRAGLVCNLTLLRNEISPAMPTVGVVEWSWAGAPPTSARIVYQLVDAGSGTLNAGGEAPVALDQPSFRTLLLGLKQGRDYSFRIEAVSGGSTCTSERFLLPTTGRFATVPSVAVHVARPELREPGFIVTSSGTSVPDAAYVIDADGEIVWYFAGPVNTSRALLDYEGKRLWMVALNVLNEGGEMRSVSLDGEDVEFDVPGLGAAHHDFTVLPGGRVAALVWSGPGEDTESQLVIRSPDGTVTSPFTIGQSLYRSDTYHVNALHYLPFDDGFTLADRNPHVLMKVSATGTPLWQLGGDCSAAPAGAACAEQDWEVVHGHHLLEDGTFVLFDNGTTGPSHVQEFSLSEANGSFTPKLVHDYAGTEASNNLGDVQRLPGGNTLVTYSTDAKLVELGPDWNEVQTFSVRAGYASWRSTLYGPPERP